MERKDRLQWISILLRRYFKGQVSPEEKDIIESWQPEEGKTRFVTDPSQVEAGCKRVKENIFDSLNISESDSIMDKTVKRIRRSVIYKYAAIAAIFILVIGTGLYMSFSYSVKTDTTNTLLTDTGSTYYETGFSEIKKITLSDGSIIHLNGGTKLGIKESEFNKQRREIWLVDGEAFFEVTQNPEKPFIIYSKDLQVKVKGTSFNVKSYSDLKTQSISVRNGKVEVSNSTEILDTLTANEQIDYNHSDESFIRKHNDYHNAMAWIDGRLVLENASAEELAVRLKQKFNISLTGYEYILQGRELNAIFDRGANLKDIMDNICTLYNVKYRIKDKEVFIYQ